MKDFVTVTMLKRYVLAMLVMGAVGLLWALVVDPRISDNSVPSETERIYGGSQRIGIDSDKHGAKVFPTDESASQREEQLEKLTQQQELQRQYKEKREKQKRVEGIEAQMAQLVPFSTQDPAQALKMLELEEEMLKLHQELGTLVTEGGDPFLGIKIGKLVLPNLTNDGRLPVSVGVEMVNLLVESGEYDGAATVYMAAQRATENGDEFFTPEHWAAQGTDGQGDSFALADPCCPDEPTPVHLEDEHGHETPTSQPPTPQAAKGVEAELSGGLSLERFDNARQLIDQYGSEEGLRRLREIDPEAAQQFEQGRRPPPTREVPSETEPSAQ